MASPKIEFNVRRKQPELLPPAEPTPYEWKELSDIDHQDGVRFHLTAIFLYPPPINAGEAVDHANLVVGMFRQTLARAMVFYYPYAGRIREGPNRKLSVECTGEGVLFCEAHADARIEQLASEGGRFHPPFPCAEKLILGEGSDVLNTPLVYAQITHFVCGGFVLSARYNHVISDAPGFAMFLTAAAQLAAGADAPTPLPVWERDRHYRARVPPRPTFVHHEYIHDDPPPTNEHSDEPWPLESVLFSKKDVAALRAQLPANLQKAATSFEIITACIWRCRVAALRYAPDEVARLIIAVNSRTKFDPPIEGYYGNSLMLPITSTKAGKLTGSDLGYVVELVREVKGRVTAEYARSAADFLALNGPVHFVVHKTYVVSDVRQLLDTSKMDVGLGEPLYGGPADVGEDVISFLGPLKDSEGEELVVVPFCLPASAIERFKEEVKKMVSVGSTAKGSDGYLSRM